MAVRGRFKSELIARMLKAGSRRDEASATDRPTEPALTLPSAS